MLARGPTLDAPFKINLSKPSFAGAIRFARMAYAAAGNDRAAGNKVLAKCLMHVDVHEGGLLGADDDAAGYLCRKLGITREQYLDALNVPGQWPGDHPRSRE